MRQLLCIVGLLAAAGCGGDKDDEETEDGPQWGLEARPANATCIAPDRPPQPGASVDLVRIYENIAWPRTVGAFQPPGDPDTWWAITQNGTVYRFADDPNVADFEVVVDLTARVDDGPNEAGLLGLAFHPDWPATPEVFVDYTAPGLTTVVSRLTSSDGGQTLDPASEEVLLTVPQPYNNHNGGHLVFGPDRRLYVGFGDGGSGGDPQGNGQDTTTLLGSIVRIDPLGGTPYAIPPDNPFAGGGGAPEIYAWGLRNPWRFSFDDATGDLWVADVGQDDVEEVDIVERGGNYGWNLTEGDACYAVDPCDDAELIPPVVVNTHAEGDQSITGGVVYRGSDIPDLVGAYVYADYVSGRIYGVFQDPATGDLERQLLLETTRDIVHFATDADGEIVIVDHFAGLYRLQPLGSRPPSTFPEKLSLTGCMRPDEPSQPGPMLVPYEPVHPFWSDGADKERWFAIPDGTTITVDDDGDWELPVGSVTVKQFRIGGELVETRLFVRHQDGDWAGYTYQWNAQGTDATLLPSAARVTVSGQEWEIPSRGDCAKCHTPAAGGTLGLSSLQLDHDIAYPNGARNNQLSLLEHVGMLEPGDRPGPLPELGDERVDLDERARAYLHVNCSSCHRTGGGGQGDLELTWWTDLAETGLCSEPLEGDLGVPGARVVFPGDPDRSVLSLRMRSRDADGMPPLGSLQVDEDGVALIDAWIESLSSCP